METTVETPNLRKRLQKYNPDYKQHNEKPRHYRYSVTVVTKPREDADSKTYFGEGKTEDEAGSKCIARMKADGINV